MTSDTKPCPFCGELIRAEAIECRVCGEFLEAVDVTGTQVNTQGGTYVGRNVKTGGDFVGRDKNSYADAVSNAIFDQRGQHVTYQYNAAGDINFGAVQNQMSLVSQLEKLQTEVAKANDAKVFDAETATDVKYNIEKATQQAKKLEPDKKTIVNYLNQAKTLALGVTAAAGLATAINQAIEAVGKLF